MPEGADRRPLAPLSAEDGELIGRLRRTLGRLEAALASISDALAISDAEGQVMWCNQAFESFTGRHRLLLLGQPITTVLPPDAEGRPLLGREQLHPLSGEGVCQRALLRHDPPLAVSIEWRPVLSERERPLVFCIRDISADLASEAMRREVDRIAAERQRFEAQALACTVTGLPNRRALEEHLALAFANLAQQPGQLTLLFCDLNGFKQVNDQYGHAAGDALLQIVGRRLQRCLRVSDLVARLGGDEFVVLSQGPRGREEATDLGRRLLEEVCRPWIHEGRALQPAMSVGIAITKSASLGAAELLRRADLAMYDAKGGQAPPLALYDAALERRNRSGQQLGRLLRQALERGTSQASALTLGSRPILELRSGRLQGLEVWPELRIPGEQPCGGQDLLLLAQRLGLSGALGRWLRGSALEQLRRQPAGGVSLVALRISGSELIEAGLSRELAALVSRHGVAASQVAVLLREDRLRDPSSDLHGELQALRRLGMQVVLDDFGASSTPLQALEHLPLTAIRLHPQLGGEVSQEGGLRPLVAAAIRLARDLDLDVIAQGICREAQIGELERLGCRWGQGPLLERERA